MLDLPAKSQDLDITNTVQMHLKGEQNPNFIQQ